MSLLSQWGSSRDEAADLILETIDGNLRSKDEEQIKKLLFAALKSAEVDAIKNILHFNRGLLNEPLHGYEGNYNFNRCCVRIHKLTKRSLTVHYNLFRG